MNGWHDDTYYELAAHMFATTAAPAAHLLASRSRIGSGVAYKTAASAPCLCTPPVCSLSTVVRVAHRIPIGRRRRPPIPNTPRALGRRRLPTSCTFRAQRHRDPSASRAARATIGTRSWRPNREAARNNVKVQHVGRELVRHAAHVVPRPIDRHDDYD